MNSAHLHLLLNHFPVIGTYISVFILSTGMIIKNRTVQFIALALLILTALMAIPAFLTGEGAEDVLKSIKQENKHFIHEHEEIAEIAIWICCILGTLAAATCWILYKNKKIANFFTIITLIAAIANSIVLAKTANSGGEIRHSEIRGLNNYEDD